MPLFFCVSNLYISELEIHMVSTILEYALGTALWGIVTVLTIVCLRMAFWCFSDLRHNDKWSQIGLGILFLCFAIMIIVSAFANYLPPHVFHIRE